MIPKTIQAELAANNELNHGHFMAKFSTDCDLWFRIAEDSVRRFRLHTGPGLRILDLGSGYGYFMLACRGHGHEIVGVDIPDPVLQQAAQILDAEYVPHKIKENDLLPDGLGTFDVVVMMGVNLRGKRGFWKQQQYRKLWRAVAGRLDPGGAWMIRPNHGPQTDCLFDEGFWQEVVGGEGRVEMHRDFVEVTRND